MKIISLVIGIIGIIILASIDVMLPVGVFLLILSFGIYHEIY